MKRLYLLASVFLISPVLNAQNVQDIPPVVMQTLNECYDDQNNTGIAIAKCALKKLQKMKNPDNYKLNVKLDSFNRKIPTDVIIVVSNKFGLVVQCRGKASDKIRLESCFKKQEAPPSGGEKLSITPRE